MMLYVRSAIVGLMHRVRQDMAVRPEGANNGGTLLVPAQSSDRRKMNLDDPWAVRLLRVCRVAAFAIRRHRG
jgi:hypothetical protein